MAPLPGDDAFAVGKGTGGAAVGQQREADGFGGSFPDGLVTPVAVEVRGGVARISGIDLDGGVTEFVGKLHGKHVEGSFGGAVADQPGGGGWVSRVAILGKRAKAA